MKHTLLSRLASLALLLCVAAPLASSQDAAPRKDHSTRPTLYFLNEGDVANSLYLLPAPPDSTSLLFVYDKDRYEWGKQQRDTERGAQAAADANVEADGVPRAFSEAFGITITPETTPEIYTLIVGMREDAGDLATREAKNHYMRTRPFAYFGEMTCNPAQQQELSTNGSYPSGHTSIGWATALVLAELNPDRQNEILKRGYEMGESRVICGYHFQSDVDAARLVASGVVARLHADPGFQAQLAKAKTEMAQLKAQGRVEPSTLDFSTK